MDSLWLGLLPSPNVSSAWRSFSDVQVWANIEDGLARSVFRVLGDPGLNSLPLIAAIPISAFENALTQAQRGTRSLYETEKAQMRVAFNAIRVCFGGSPLGMMQTAGPSATETVPTTPAEVSTKIKLKMNQVIDQGCDMEVEQLGHEKLLSLRQRFLIQEGDNPMENEEITDGQLSCLHGKIAANMAPFVDMGVWGPYGDRIARAMKFVSQQWKDGQWRSVELPGASHLRAWEESWRIFRTGCIMLNVATAAILDRYANEFRNRVSQHPDIWFLAAQADIRCRSEFWAQERLRQESFHQAHPNMSAYVVDMPWNSVIKASATNQEFWHREFERPAMLYVVNGVKPSPSVPPPPKPDRTPAKIATKKTFDPRRKDGRHLKSESGLNICYAWAREKDGCSNGECERGFAHICEWCRQPHKSIDCPKVPNWDPTKSSDKPSGGGKGRGRGLKRKHQHM